MTAQPPVPGAPSVVVEELVAGYGRRRVLHGVDLSFGEGIVVLAGPNGAGKSTFLRVVATLLMPESGRVRVFGHDVAATRGRREARRSLGFLPQEPAFPGDFTVGDMLRYTTWVQRLPAAAVPDALEWARRRFDLAEAWGTRLSRLSGGTRQRAFLAQATVHDPGLVLLDEPTLSVDPAHRAVFRDLLVQMAEARTVVLTTHLVEDMERLPARLIVIQSGKVAFDGSAEGLAAAGRSIPALTAEHPLERALRALAGGEPR